MDEELFGIKGLSTRLFQVKCVRMLQDLEQSSCPEVLDIIKVCSASIMILESNYLLSVLLVSVQQCLIKI